MAPKIIVGVPHFFRRVYMRQGKFSLNFSQIGILDQKLQSFTLGTAQHYRANFQAATASRNDEQATYKFNTMFLPGILTRCIKFSNIEFLECSQSTVVS